MNVTSEMYPNDRDFVKDVLVITDMSARKLALTAAINGKITTTGLFLTHAPDGDAFNASESAWVMALAYSNSGINLSNLESNQTGRTNRELPAAAVSALNTASDLYDLAGEVDRFAIFRNLK